VRLRLNRDGRAFHRTGQWSATKAAEEAGIRRIVELTSLRYRLASVSATFHGRDIFAPAAAHLWRGVRLTAFGPELSGMLRWIQARSR